MTAERRVNRSCTKYASRRWTPSRRRCHWTRCLRHPRLRRRGTAGGRDPRVPGGAQRRSDPRPDLPDADVLIQVSGAFGSRQEEAQRLGRILRPKSDGRTARFFTLVSRDTREEEFAHHRKLFLTEQGYSYQVRLADTTVAPSR